MDFARAVIRSSLLLAFALLALLAAPSAFAQGYGDCGGVAGEAICNRAEAYAACEADEAAAATAITWGTAPVCSLNTDGGASGSYRCNGVANGSSTACRAVINQGANRFYYWSGGACPAGRTWDAGTNTCKLSCPGGFGEDAYNPGTCMTSEKCLAKNVDLAKGPVVRGFTSSCTLDGCQISMVSNDAQVSVDGFYTGVYEYTGNSCATPPAQPLAEEAAKEPPEQKCSTAGSGQTFCIKPDGQHCYSASTGRQVCWRPTEAGEKTDRDAMQKRVPGPSELPPANLNLPSGDTLQKSGNSITKTTTITNTTNNTTTVITTTVTNYKTVNGTDAGTSQQGENSDGTGGEGEEGDGEKGAGSEDCDVVPTCSSTDTIGCAMLRQLHTNTCREETIFGTNEGQVDEASEIEGIDAGSAIGKLWGSDQPSGDDLFGGVDTSGFGERGSCPIGFTFSAMGRSYTLDDTQLCLLLDALAALVLVIGGIHSAMIIASGVRR